MQYTDQMGRTLCLPHWPPRRIVSLVPSQTELLHHLGLGEAVVGITKFCVHPPEWQAQKARVGGTKTVLLERVAALQPDLIIGNKEENEREQIAALAERWPVWMSDILTLEDALAMIEGLGALTGRAAAADRLRQQMTARFEAWQASRADRPPRRAAYFIWRKPYMVAAADTFLHDMLGRAGFQNTFAHLSRYPEVTLEQVAAAQPEVLLLSSEPYPFEQKHFGPLQEACPHAHIRVVDGEMFSWYGSRLLWAPEYFRSVWECLPPMAGQAHLKP
ncbi:MAG TPA: helical backbone metal receptor [Saprospiraceae bacterium]|nr:helical backbone metal receptor [Saprospiraceae bacterium]